MTKAAELNVHPGDVVSGNIVVGEITVRSSFPNGMPESGAHVRFAGRRWLVTRTGVSIPGGRKCFVAILLVPDC